MNGSPSREDSSPNKDELLLTAASHHRTLSQTSLYTETFEGENWIGEKYDFRGKKLSQPACLCRTKDTMPPNFAEKTFVNSHKTAKFAKVFSLKSFPLYGMLFPQFLHPGWGILYMCAHFTPSWAPAPSCDTYKPLKLRAVVKNMQIWLVLHAVCSIH